MSKNLVENLGKAMRSNKKRAGDPAYTSTKLTNNSGGSLIKSSGGGSYVSYNTGGVNSAPSAATAGQSAPAQSPAGETYIGGKTLRKSKKRTYAKKTWRRVVDNKMRGAYGETDFENKTIKVNKKKSKERPLYKRPVNKGATKYPDVLATMVHEELHKDNPSMTEKNVRKAERAKVAKMSSKEKKRVYSRYK